MRAAILFMQFSGRKRSQRSQRRPFAGLNRLVALPELLAAQRVFHWQFVVVNALLDEQEILRIRRVDRVARKQIGNLILALLTVEPGDLVNGFQPRRPESIGTQVCRQDQWPGVPEPMLEARNLIERIPDLLIPSAQRHSL